MDLYRVAQTIEQRRNWMPGEIIALLIKVQQSGVEKALAELDAGDNDDEWYQALAVRT